MEGMVEGRIEVTERGGRKCKQLLDGLKVNERLPEIERGSTSSRCTENSLWRRLWTCLKTDCGMDETRWYLNTWLLKIKRSY